MSEQNFEDRNNSPLINDTTDRAMMNSPQITSDPYVDVVPMDKAFVNDIPALGGVNEAVAKEIPMAKPAPAGMNVTQPVSLLNREESDPFRKRWSEIQGMFVDEPRSAVQQADGLVTDVIAKISQIFAKEHSLLEGQWKQGEEVSTEDLRKALMRYRTFFNRLIA